MKLSGGHISTLQASFYDIYDYGHDGNGDDDDDGDKDEDDDSPLASVCEVLVFSDRSGVKILAANACWERKKTI